MKSTYFFMGIGILLLLFGCVSDNQGQDNLYNYKGVTIGRDNIPSKCWEKEDCAMFSCMVSQCWCMPAEVSGQPTDGIVGNAGKHITTEQDAKVAVATLLNSKNIQYNKILNVAKLNELFYNVFYEDELGNEQVLTVAVDGTMMVTACGV